MKLTPLDIRHQEFRRAMRGYSEEQVDVFLDEVADEFERLFQDNIELRERIQLLDEQVTGYENLKETLNNTLVSAQQLADSTRANANKEGELILRDAELKARGIVGEANSEKQRVQQSLIQLRQVEEDFRFKFRSLLEAHINLLAEDGASDERRRF
ncbi:MAG: DivIVA domain-containing protein, partial [Thermoleophilia bacterium]|nr:DivIVA domain-containing protein [Thermoleophilia bacterium]